MTEQNENLVLEILRRIQTDISELKNELAETKKDLQEGFGNANAHLAAIESHTTDFHITIATHRDEINSLRKRIERIERRLDLVDT